MEGAIERVEEELKRVGEKLFPLEEKPLQQRDDDEKAEITQLRKEKEQLRKKEEQLRKKEEQLRKEKEQLREERLLLLQRGSGPRGAVVTGESMLFFLRVLQRLTFILAWRPDPQASNKSVRTGLPLMELPKVSESRPSLDTGHAPASLQERDDLFRLISESGDPRQPLRSSVWLDLDITSGIKLRHTAEASVQSYVVSVLKDVIYELGLNHALEMTKEVATFGLRPDAWVMTLLGLPVGVVEVKNPGDGALSDKRVAGELYDYMMRLPNFYGTQEAFGILTSYRKWRVCWMDDEETRKLAASEVLIDTGRAADPETPVRRKGSVGGKEQSPEATPSKEKACVHPLTFHEEDTHSGDAEDDEISVDAQNDGDNAERVLLCTRVYDIEDKSDNRDLFRLLASAILKMWNCVPARLDDPFESLGKRTVLKFTRDSVFWSRVDSVKPQWDKMPTQRAEKLFAVEDLGHGAEGRCWLVCTAAGRVAVLKFFRIQDPKAAAMREKERWDAVYPALGKMVRVEQWGGHWALVMPHLSQSVSRDKRAVDAVRRTLQEDYVDRGWTQPVREVRWRNIGFYSDQDGHSRAVVFDMSHVERNEEENSSWVDDCIGWLNGRLERQSVNHDESEL